MTDKREFEFEIDAPREQVWRALVDPEALLGWFASDARVTPEIGGEYYIAHGEHAQGSTIEEIVPGERLRTRWEDTTTEFILEGREGMTFLRIVHSGFGDDGYESLESGWAKYIQTLRHYLTLHADEPAAAAYLYSKASGSIGETREALPATLPAGAGVFDESPRSLGARVPELGDGMYRSSIEGSDGQVFVWVHLVAYGAGRDRLAAVREEVEGKLALEVLRA